MSLEPNDFRDGYVRRVVDAELDELLPSLPAVLLDGAKGVGKTETAMQRSASVRRLDQAVDREIVAADLDGIASAAMPLLLDEWQRLPQIWDSVRRHVDSDSTGGQFLLTGSTPTSVPDIETHSGAGRISTIRLRPLTLVERWGVEPAVSMRDLIDGSAGTVSGTSSVGLRDYTEEIVRGGFPGMRHLDGRALRNRLDGYLDLIVGRELIEAGLRVRRPEIVMGWLRAYAAATATTTSWEKLRLAANPGHTPPAVSTTAPYIELLAALRVLDPLPAWFPTRNHLRSLTGAAKHHLADPALAARLLNTSTERLLAGNTSDIPIVRDGPLLGALFESLVTLSVRVFAQAAEAQTFHLRTKGGRHEVDLVVESARGVVGIEVKLAPSVTDEDVVHLLWLREQLGDDCSDLIVVTTGPEAYRRSDGIAVVPLALLGP